jgi:hypothetical protein
VRRRSIPVGRASGARASRSPTQRESRGSASARGTLGERGEHLVDLFGGCHTTLDCAIERRDREPRLLTSPAWMSASTMSTTPASGGSTSRCQWSRMPRRCRRVSSGEWACAVLMRECRRARCTVPARRRRTPSSASSERHPNLPRRERPARAVRARPPRDTGRAAPERVRRHVAAVIAPARHSERAIRRASIHPTCSDHRAGSCRRDGPSRHLCAHGESGACGEGDAISPAFAFQSRWAGIACGPRVLAAAARSTGCEETEL